MHHTKHRNQVVSYRAQRMEVRIEADTAACKLIMQEIVRTALG